MKLFIRIERGVGEGGFSNQVTETKVGWDNDVTVQDLFAAFAEAVAAAGFPQYDVAPRTETPGPSLVEGDPS